MVSATEEPVQVFVRSFRFVRSTFGTRVPSLSWQTWISTELDSAKVAWTKHEVVKQKQTAQCPVFVCNGYPVRTKCMRGKHHAGTWRFSRSFLMSLQVSTNCAKWSYSFIGTSLRWALMRVQLYTTEYRGETASDSCFTVSCRVFLCMMIGGCL